ncbi:hypothetical protein KJK34_04690 [Flavobacterium sp. D11R37]|nr:hypothetical protein [Flavobacterium coralii]MBY8962044.1 hypothetical protein [Flavobacterium coralii]
MTSKEVSALMGVTVRTAQRYLKNIKDLNGIPKVTFKHYAEYFGIN